MPQLAKKKKKTATKNSGTPTDAESRNPAKMASSPAREDPAAFWAAGHLESDRTASQPVIQTARQNASTRDSGSRREGGRS